MGRINLLVNIKKYCTETGISRATFYRKLHKGEIDAYKTPSNISKRLLIISPKNKTQTINESNVLEHLETENEKMQELLLEAI